MKTTYNVPPPEVVDIGMTVGNATGEAHFYKDVQDVLKNMELDEDAIANTLVLTVRLGGISSKSKKFKEYLDVVADEFVGYWCEKTQLTEDQLEIVSSEVISHDRPEDSQQSFSLVPSKGLVTQEAWVDAFLNLLDQETKDLIAERKQVDTYEYTKMTTLLMDEFADMLAQSESLRKLTERKYVVAGKSYDDAELIYWKMLADAEHAKTEEASE